MRDLLAGRRGYDHGSSLVRECRRDDELCRRGARKTVCTLLANQSDWLLVLLEWSAQDNVQFFSGHLDGLPKPAPETLQGRGRGLYRTLDETTARGKGCRDR